MRPNNYAVKEAARAAGKNNQDPLKDESRIHKLDGFNFTNFLKSKDMALVMFYQSGDPESVWSAKHFKLAACNSNRPNHAYAAVDCLTERELCDEHRVLGDIPVFVLYSKGYTVGTVRDTSSFTADIIRKYVQKSPTLNEPKGESMFQRKGSKEEKTN